MKKKLIRKMTIDTIGSSSVVKKITSLVNFVFYFTIIVIILFISYDGIPNSAEEAKKYIWVFVALSLVWYASKNSNFNINISYNITIFTFIMPLVFLALTSSFLWKENNHSYQEIIDYVHIIPWLIVFIATNILWKLIMIFSEKNTRPFFAKEQFFKMVMEIIIIIILIFAFETFIPMLMIDKLNFVTLIDNVNTKMLFSLITTGMLIIIGIILIFTEQKRLKQNNYISVRIKRTMSLYNSLLVLGPITIWFLVKVHISNLLWIEWIYIITIISCAVLCTLSVFSKGESGATSKVYLLISNSTLFVIVVLLFLMTISENMRFIFGVYFALPVIIYILILNAIIGPETPPTYGVAYYGLALILSFYLITIWSLQILIPTWDRHIPFSFDKILWLAPIIIMFYLEILVATSTLNTYRLITKHSIKINKYQNKNNKKKFIHRKISKNKKKVVKNV